MIQFGSINDLVKSSRSNSVNIKTSIKEIKKDFPTPANAYQKIKKSFEGNSFLLETLGGPKKTARYSFIGFDAIFDIKCKKNEVKLNGKTITTNNPYKFLKNKFHEINSGTINFLPFSSGMVGYFSYDTVKYFESLPDTTKNTLDLPDYHFIVPSKILCFDHQSEKNYLISHSDENDLKDIFKIEIDTDQKLEIQNIRSITNKQTFIDSVKKTKEYIKKGDIFQAVLSRKKQVNINGNEFNIYRALREINPSPYLFYLDFDESRIIGSSPEMLVKLEENTLTTRPLAGTRKRSNDDEIDEKYKINMILDEKDRSEHLMLVDLHRNDMGKVSRYGSVKVDELMGVEKYSHVQHIVSNIVSKLKKEKDCFDAFKACFPAGTVSGAPKIRAMKIIDELERERRGPYGGAVGYFDFSGDMEFAITIRSVIVKENSAYIQAGAGIVSDSDPEKEYTETENKMEAMINAVEGEIYE